MSSFNSKTSIILDQLRETNRPVLVFGATLESDPMVRQRHSWVGPLAEAGIKDRDLVILELPASGAGTSGSEALDESQVKTLRDTFAIDDAAFTVLLIGRDGSEKARWTDVVSAQEVFGKVDAMPMRVQEVQEQRGGSATTEAG